MPEEAYIEKFVDGFTEYFKQKGFRFEEERKGSLTGYDSDDKPVLKANHDSLGRDPETPYRNMLTIFPQFDMDEIQDRDECWEIVTVEVLRTGDVRKDEKFIQDTENYLVEENYTFLTLPEHVFGPQLAYCAVVWPGVEEAEGYESDIPGEDEPEVDSNVPEDPMPSFLSLEPPVKNYTEDAQEAVEEAAKEVKS